MSHDDELTPGERAALAALPREREPAPLLEERTVRALRAEGLITPMLRKVRRLPWLVATAAAGLVLYLGGIATGQWMANRQTTDALVRIQQNTMMQAASLVQRTGSAYAQAIAALANTPDSADRHSAAQGREVALTALYSAANELVRLAPDDPVVVRILQVLDREPERSDGSTTGTLQRVVWF